MRKFKIILTENTYFLVFIFGAINYRYYMKETRGRPYEELAEMERYADARDFDDDE